MENETQHLSNSKKDGDEDNIELDKVYCRLCPVEVHPSSRGIWYNDYTICKACAQNVWMMMQMVINTSKK